MQKTVTTVIRRPRTLMDDYNIIIIYAVGIVRYCPDGSGTRPKKRKTGGRGAKETGFTGINGLWLDEHLRLRARTPGHFSFM